MRRQKRGSAELFTFAIVAVVTLGGMILLARGLTKRIMETTACLEECSLKHGLPPKDGAETCIRPMHKTW